MKAFLKKISMIVLAFSLLISCLFFTGCYSSYEGEHPDLCSVAWVNIPTLSGYISNGEVVRDPDVSILETDSYGRVLFFYSEDEGGRRGYALVMQRSDGANAYYYPDDCYVPVTLASSEERPDQNANELVALKALNDWGLPINETKCKKTEIVRERLEGKLDLDEEFFDKIAIVYLGNAGLQIQPKSYLFARYFRYVTSDDYGRELYYFLADFNKYTHKSETQYSFGFLVIVNPDKSYDMSTVVLLEDENDPREDMKRIKEQTGWNTEP